MLPIPKLRAVTLEKPDAAGVANLVVGLVDHAAHVAFVVLVWPENIEVLHADGSLQEGAPCGGFLNQTR